jgi:hypothetical protein
MPTWTNKPSVHPYQTPVALCWIDEYTCGKYTVVLYTPKRTKQYLSLLGPEGEARLFQYPTLDHHITPAMLLQAVKVFVAIGADPKDLP